MKVLLVAIAIMIAFSNGYTCTIFSITSQDHVLVGNNEDYLYSENYYFKVVPTDKDNYGRMMFYTKFIVFDGVQGGMNEKGLFLDCANVNPGDKIMDRPDSNCTEELSFDIHDKLLSKCANVREAIEFLRKIKWNSSSNRILREVFWHYLIADSSGTSVIIEWVNGGMQVIENKTNYQIAVNYLKSKPKIPGSGFEREIILERKIAALSNINRDDMVSLLKSASQHTRKDSGTIYSNIYDLNDLTMAIFIKRDSANIRTFNLKEEMKLGVHECNVRDLINTKY